MKKSFLFILLLLCVAGAQGKEIRGSVRSGKKSLGGVVVSDGVNITLTDSKGRFRMEADDTAPFVWVVTPSGYVAPYDSGSPKFYIPLSDKLKKYDFNLASLGMQDYKLLAIGDPQPKTEGHAARFDKECLPDLAATVESIRAAGEPVFGIILGDIVWDSPRLTGKVKESLATLRIPFYPVIGNHDHLIAEAEDFASTANYRNHFGPTYYAFDAGDSHYIVLDDIEYFGNKNYKTSIAENQLEWVEKYMGCISDGKRVVVAMHAPFSRYWNGVKVGNGDRLMEILGDREVHFLTGHAHINSNMKVGENATEHNVAQIAGNLWHDPINRDGSPRGYQIFTEKGGNLSWQYKTLDKDLSHQMVIYGRGSLRSAPEAILVKVWNWDDNWTVECSEDGGAPVRMQRISAADPACIERVRAMTAKAKDEKEKQMLQKRHSPRKAFFYFTTTPSADARSVEVKVTDRFGNVYTEIYELKQ